jgi:hypothetical protein
MTDSRPSSSIIRVLTAPPSRFACILAFVTTVEAFERKLEMRAAGAYRPRRISRDKTKSP